MREQRYIFQGSIVFLFLLWNLYCFELLPRLPKAIPIENESLALVAALICSVIISPGIGYLLYSIIHVGFLLLGGWSGFYRRNNVDTVMLQAVNEIATEYSKSTDLDVLVSFVFNTTESDIKYVEWIRRRMDAVFISSAIILYIFLIDAGFYLFMLVTHRPILYSGRLWLLWGVSFFLIIVLFFILRFEKKAAHGIPYHCSR